MTRRSRLLAVLMAMAVVAASCGGNGGSEGDAAGSDVPIGQSSNGSSEGAEDGDEATGDADSEGTGGGEAPDLDPSNMPPAGEVVLVVDGQTFTIRADDMDYFTCDIGDDFINVRSESETQDLAVQMDPVSGRGNANLTPAGSAVTYNSFVGPETAGVVTVEAPYIVYEARFDATDNEDFSFTDVGTGRVSVTCP